MSQLLRRTKNIILHCNSHKANLGVTSSANQIQANRFPVVIYILMSPDFLVPAVYSLMTRYSFLCALFGLSLVLADPCSDLDRLLNLRAGSYSKKEYCHALFWQIARGNGPICFHSSATGAECPTNHPLLVSEAENELRIRREGGSQASAQIPSREPSMSAEPSTQTTTTSPRAPARQRTSRWVKPSGPIEIEPFLSPSSSSMEILVMGDTGHASNHLRRTVRAASGKVGSIVHSAILLGDNFYTVGIQSDISDPQFEQVFVNSMASHFPGIVFHPVLGNHDWMGNADAQLEYTSVNPQWMMPYYYYRRRFASADGSIQTCVWFLDTEHLRPKSAAPEASQISWLEETLPDPTCQWKIVVGHHPIFDSGEYSDNADMIRNVLPILEAHGVHLYMSGHEHQTLIFNKPQRSRVHFIISGCTSEKRSGKIHRRPSEAHPPVYENRMGLAFVQLSISARRLTYKIHNAESTVLEESPLFEGHIEQ